MKEIHKKGNRNDLNEEVLELMANMKHGFQFADVEEILWKLWKQF